MSGIPERNRGRLAWQERTRLGIYVRSAKSTNCIGRISGLILRNTLNYFYSYILRTYSTDLPDKVPKVPTVPT